jgi:hypothetical protein
LLVSRDDVELQRPEDVRFVLPVFHTAHACAGSATAYILRRIAYRAGAYAPGIQEQMFHELNSGREGGSIEKVQRWFNTRVSMLHQLGYRLQARRVATPTPTLLDWVRAGRGHRGAMLPTSFRRMHPTPGAGGKDNLDESVAHAVGITMENLDAKSDEDLVMIDAWPGVKGDAPDRGPVPTETLENAHRDRGFHALVFFWVGWS